MRIELLLTKKDAEEILTELFEEKLAKYLPLENVSFQFSWMDVFKEE